MARLGKSGRTRLVGQDDRCRRLSDWAEDAAKLIVENVLSGVEMVRIENQSNGEPDYDMLKGGERFGVLEVTMAADERLLESHEAILHPRDAHSRGGMFVQGRCVTHGWLLYFRAGADIRRIRKEADERLADIEREGLDRFFCAADDARKSTAVWNIWKSLGVYGGLRRDWREPRLIGLSLPSQGVISKGAQHVQEAVEQEAKKEDNRRKLNRDGPLERHLFVVVHSNNDAPWYSMNDCPPPLHGPDLPIEITTAWVAAPTRDQGRWIVWSADGRHGWSAHGVVPCRPRPPGPGKRRGSP